MTPDQLRSVEGFADMCNSEPFRIMLAYFHESCPYVAKDCADATAALRNEGRMSGWFTLLKEMRAIHRSKPQPEKETTKQLYADPDDRNRPKSNL